MTTIVPFRILVVLDLLNGQSGIVNLELPRGYRITMEKEPPFPSHSWPQSRTQVHADNRARNNMPHTRAAPLFFCQQPHTSLS